MRLHVRIMIALLMAAAGACTPEATPTTPPPTVTVEADSAATEQAATRVAALEATMAAFTAIAENPPTVLVPSATDAPPTQTPSPTDTAIPSPSATASATSTPTSQPSPTPVTPTLTPDPNGPTAQGRITSFSVAPAEGRLDRGQVVTLAWVGVGLDAAVCVTYESNFSEDCQPLPVSGTLSYTLRTQDPVANHWADFELRVNGDFSSETRSLRVLIKCLHTWFQDGLSEWCPTENVRQLSAIAQPFEKGYAIWYQSVAYVFFNEAGNPYRSYGPLPSTAPNLSSLQPPAGRFPPAPELGTLWMGQVTASGDVRNRLGWATAPATPYTLSTQCARIPDGTGPCFYTTPDAGILALQTGTFISSGVGGTVVIVEGSFQQLNP